MKMLEYQAKRLLAEYGVPVPKGVVCRAEGEVAAAWQTLVEPGALGAAPQNLVLKAQVPSGKRGKGGGILVARSAAEAREAVTRLLASEVCGFPVPEVLAEQQLPGGRELYLSVLTGTAPSNPRPVVMLSAEGGMEIEDLAREFPDSINAVRVDPAYGLLPYQARGLARRAGLDATAQAQLVQIIAAAYRAYWESDAELVEINPLTLLPTGGLVALDAKVTIDNAARHRHPELEGARIDSVETRAAALGLSYVELEGDIGLISNGAGLTMATMDHLALLGGRPANFLDTGERVLRGGIPDGLGLLLANPAVRVVLINIFGGGVRCDVIAERIVEAVRALPVGHIPIVASLHGRNDAVGQEMLQQAALPRVTVLPTIEEALREAVRLSREPAPEEGSGR
ncbi:MAG: succinate--CoA ligase subunit beta [Gaiellales bacterium]|nr:succinate--CoA ligase subunit beta [Gaiellales bacterium]